MIITKVGIPTVPITSKTPGKNFNAWYKNKKFHSGFGVKVVSSGSAGPVNGGALNAESVRSNKKSNTATRTSRLT